MSATKKIIDLREIVIKKDFNARVMFDDQLMEELQKSILKSGLRLPITVKKIELTEENASNYEIWKNGEKAEVSKELIGTDVFQLVDGERRLRAHINLLEQRYPIKGIVADLAKTNTKEDTLLIDGYLKNTGEKYNPMEEAILFNKMIKVYNWTSEEIADEIGKSVATINSRLNLLNASKELTEAVLKKEIGVTTATDIIHQSKGDPILQDEKVKEIKEAGKDVVAEEKKNKKKAAMKEELKEELKKEMEGEMNDLKKDYPKNKEENIEDTIQDIDEDYDPLDEGEDITPEPKDDDEDIDDLLIREDINNNQIIDRNQWLTLLQVQAEELVNIIDDEIEIAYRFGKIQAMAEILQVDIYEYVDDDVIQKFI